MVQAQENVIEEFNRQGIAVNHKQG
jgi:hypothetical protein